MATIDAQGRPEPPLEGDEVAVLTGFLEYQRATLAWKTAGLDADGLAARTAASSLTLGGLLKHLAFVEDHWFSHVLLGRERASIWRDADFAADPDWEWTSAAGDAPDGLRRLWVEACAASRTALDEALARGGLEQLAAGPTGWPERPSLRWILLHMVEEYARHNGHADLLREAVDGEVGE
jgi:uncharacterized damage-inducible protein DinB